MLISTNKIGFFAVVLWFWLFPLFLTGAQTTSLRQPVRLTAGASNQSMGMLDPQETALYFISDQNATSELFVQTPPDSGSRLLLDSNADIAWPKVSPDGKRLAYISYHSDASGDLCVLNLDDLEQRCLTGIESSEMQVVWLDSSNVAFLTRPSMHENHSLHSINIDNRDAARTLISQNMINPTVSPDGRWIAFVPVEREAERVGVNFSNRTKTGLILYPIDGASASVSYQPDLPGVTGFPAFSACGRFLYFSQYLNDTNRDGVIDGNDNSVLFRVEFQSKEEKPILNTQPEQLTSAAWNCNYPSLSKNLLVMTCSQAGSLDIYTLPLDGAIPSEWNPHDVKQHLQAARSHWTKLLLFAKLLNLEKQTHARIDTLHEMVFLHTQLREYESALRYCDQIIRLTKETDIQTAVPHAKIMQEQVLHRREDIALIHGQLSERYIQSELQRIDRLEKLREPLSGDMQALADLVISEIRFDIGHKNQAKQLITKINPLEIRSPLIIKTFIHRIAQQESLSGDRQALLFLYHHMSTHPSMSISDRLQLSEDFITELTRGEDRETRKQLVDAWLQKIKPDTELAVMLQVMQLLLDLNEQNQEAVRAGIFEIYKKHKDLDKRRAIVLQTIKTASKLGIEYLQYQFATTWASLLKRSNPERKHAEDLYEKIVLERAYAELFKNQVEGARAHFFATTLRTDSLEAHMGFIEAWIREKRGDLWDHYKKRFQKNPDHPIHHYVQAYLLARDIAGIVPHEKFYQTFDQAFSHLKRSAGSFPRSPEVQNLQGYLLHQKFVRNGNNHDAASAYNHYYLALDLAYRNPRMQATLLLQLGLLQAQLGNHRMAIKYYQQRDRLPYVRSDTQLSQRMALAKSYFHIHDHQQAVALAREALKLVKSRSELQAYLPLVMDRLALYNNAAQDYQDAFDLYVQLGELFEKPHQIELGTPINRLKLQLGLASSALGLKKYATATEHIHQVQAILTASTALRPETEQPGRLGINAFKLEKTAYQILANGLLAQAERGSGNYQEAAIAMQHRYDMLAKRFETTNTDEDLLDMAQASYHLGEYAYKQNQPVQARLHFEQGLNESNQYNQRTGSGVNPTGLRLLRALAELHLQAEPKMQQNQALDLTQQVEKAYEFICTHPSPNWERDRFLLGLYLTMLKIQNT